MNIWTVYQNPGDHPDKHVARRFWLEKPTHVFFVGPSLAAVRDWIREDARQLGCEPIRLDRSPADDPVIVESWL